VAEKELKAGNFTTNKFNIEVTSGEPKEYPVIFSIGFGLGPCENRNKLRNNVGASFE